MQAEKAENRAVLPVVPVPILTWCWMYVVVSVENLFCCEHAAPATHGVLENMEPQAGLCGKVR